jgi:hypothetical protein
LTIIRGFFEWSHEHLLEKRKFGLITTSLVVLGYLSAGLFYWRWGGIPSIVQDYACPLCPNIDSSDSALKKFFARTIGMGTINAAILIGGFVLFVVMRIVQERHLKKSTDN